MARTRRRNIPSPAAPWAASAAFCTRASAATITCSGGATPRPSCAGISPCRTDQSAVRRRHDQPRPLDRPRRGRTDRIGRRRRRPDLWRQEIRAANRRRRDGRRLPDHPADRTPVPADRHRRGGHAPARPRVDRRPRHADRPAREGGRRHDGERRFAGLHQENVAHRVRVSKLGARGFGAHVATEAAVGQVQAALDELKQAFA